MKKRNTRQKLPSDGQLRELLGTLTLTELKRLEREIDKALKRTGEPRAAKSALVTELAEFQSNRKPSGKSLGDRRKK